MILQKVGIVCGLLSVVCRLSITSKLTVMKPSTRLVAAGILLSFAFFTSCKKQIDEPVANESLSQPLSIPSTSCKPAIYGMYQTNTCVWTTIAQKWYAAGKVQNIKTHFTGRPPT